MTKCLACYKELKDENKDFHEKCSKKIFNTKNPPVLNYTLTEIQSLAKEVIKKRVAIPGVQPKLSLTFGDDDTPDKRLTIVGLWEGLYILKPSSQDFPELPENEDATMHLAEISNIKTATHSLIRFKTGELAYLSTRFDRLLKRNKVLKIHQEDMCQITGLLTENKYNSSMEKVAKAVNTYTTNKGLELLELFKLTVFSFLTGNSDMHLKNFSLVYKKEGLTELSKAYDLLATKLAMPEDQEESALTICGKKNRLNETDFKKFSEHCNLNEKAYENVLESFESYLPSYNETISMSFLSDESAKRYLDLIRSRAERLNLSVPSEFLHLKR